MSRSLRGPAAATAIAIAATALTALWVMHSGSPSSPGTDPPGRAVVVRVVDGDTVVLDLGGYEEPARLIGIDTPESVAPGRPVECYGAEASARLGELLPAGTPVDVARDVEPRDRYDRLLVYLHRATDGLFVNAAQVEDGYAEARDYPPNTTFRADFTRAEHTARAAGRGLWGACGGPDVALGPPG
ncbi:MAG TPA: thermonuclease family protein [Acidimicrobiales bacterium]|nr:thermonuclease family protein [Acidimicrobiales bacterium]